MEDESDDAGEESSADHFAELMALSGMPKIYAERDPDEECERFMNALVQSSSLVRFGPFRWKVMEPKMLCFQNSSLY